LSFSIILRIYTIDQKEKSVIAAATGATLFVLLAWLLGVNIDILGFGRIFSKLLLGTPFLLPIS